MYALFTEVNIPEGTPTDSAPEGIRNNAVPAVRKLGAVHAYWTEALNGRALGLALFEDEATARAAADEIQVGARPGPAPEGVTFRTVEVREVIVHL